MKNAPLSLACALPRTDTAPRWTWLPALLACAVCLALQLGPALLAPHRRAVGSWLSEGPSHLWGLSAAAHGILEHGPFLRVAEVGFPGVYRDHLMDPISLLVFAPVLHLAGGGVTAEILAWNALHAAAMLLGAWGCWRLGRLIYAHHPAWPWATGLLVLAFCASPFWVNQAESGRSEYLGAVLWPWHLALLLEAVRSERRWPWRPLLGAGLLLGAMVLGGWYLAVFVALMELPVGLYLLWRGPFKIRLARLGIVASIALLCLLPALLAFAGHNDPSYAHTSPSAPILAWFRLIPRPSLDNHLEPLPYVGALCLLLGLVGSIRHRRRGLPWLLLAFWGLALSAGPFVVTGLDGSNLQYLERGLPMPAFWVGKLPFLSQVSFFGRISCLAALPAAVAAGMGFTVLAPRRAVLVSVLAAALAALLLADHLSYPRQQQLLRPSFDHRAPAGLVQAAQSLPAGGLLLFPIELSSPGQHTEHGRLLLWQRQLGHPISATRSPFPDATGDWCTLTRLVARVQRHSHQQGASSAQQVGWRDKARVAGDLRKLGNQGFSAVGLLRGLARAEGLEPMLRELLGPPSHELPEALFWVIGAGEPEPG